MKSFKMFIEMSRNSGLSHSDMDDTTYRSTLYNHYKNDPIKEDHKNFSIHKKVKDHEGRLNTTISTLDHNKKEALHHSVFKSKPADSLFPYHHQAQELVERKKEDDVLPKGHATNIAYTHFKESDLPLRTSDTQQPKGHKMWHQLVDNALKDEHHVYHWDGKQLHKTTEENKKQHLQNSFGSNYNFENQHMLLSKKELK